MEGGVGVGVLGLEGCVRSKPVVVWWSQKFEGGPMRAFRGVVEVIAGLNRLQLVGGFCTEAL